MGQKHLTIYQRMSQYHSFCILVQLCQVAAPGMKLLSTTAGLFRFAASFTLQNGGTRRAAAQHANWQNLFLPFIDFTEHFKEISTAKHLLGLKPQTENF